MRKVLFGLSPNQKFFAKLQGVWGVTTGHDKPRYVDAKSLRSGYLGMTVWNTTTYQPSGALVASVYLNGTCSPDKTGFFSADGIYNSKTSYVNADADWYIWWDNTDTWNISEVKGTTGARGWSLTAADVTGSYTAYGTATGSPAVSEERSVSVIGSPDPDVAGAFFVSGYYNSVQAYTNEGGSWHVWWDNVDTWNISQAKGTQGDVYWSLTAADVNGAYTAGGDAVADATITLVQFGLDMSTHYSIKVEAVDERFASTSGVYRKSSPTLAADAIRPTATGQLIKWTIPVHPQTGYDDIAGSADTETTLRRIYLGMASEEALLDGATYQRADVVSDNTTTSWLQEDDDRSTTEPDSDALPPPYAKICISAYNRMWMACGISEERGEVTPTAPVSPETRYSLVGNTSGTDQTYFREGHEGATVTIERDRSYTVDEVDATLQILYLEETFTGTVAVSTEFKLVSDFGLYWSSIDNPHHWPLANYVPIDGYATSMWAAGRSVYVASRDYLHRFAAAAPEQGWIRLPQKIGCASPYSIVVYNDVSYFFDGTGFSGCDEIEIKNISNYRIRDLLQDIDPDYVHLITGAVDQLTNTIYWHFPVDGLMGNHYGIEFHPDTGDMYPIWRPDVSMIWEENGTVYYGTSGYFSEDSTSVIWELDPDYELDGVSASQAIYGTVKSIVGRVVTVTMEAGTLPTTFSGLPLVIRISETEDLMFVCGDGTNGDVLETFAGDWLATFSSGLLKTFVSGAGRDLQVWLHSDYDLTSITIGGDAWLGIIPFSFGPKWLDFGSPRYEHRVYELDLDFMPLGGPVTLVLDWYENLGTTPVKTQEYTLATGDTKLQAPLRHHPVYSIGFKVRVYGKYRIQIMHYNVTWATIR